MAALGSPRTMSWAFVYMLIYVLFMTTLRSEAFRTVRVTSSPTKLQLFCGNSSRPNFALLLARRRRFEDNDESQQQKSQEGKIPQLPPPSSASRPNQVSAPEGVIVGSRKLQLQYTCNICETRNCHAVSRIAYRSGVVVVRCKGCDSQHLIADNLGWTDYKGGFEGSTNTIEDYFQAQGDVVHRVSRDVFDLEKVLSRDTTSGSIVGDDGALAME